MKIQKTALDFEERLKYFRSFSLLEDQDDEELTSENPPFILNASELVSTGSVSYSLSKSKETD